jgi:hypothetical protein
MAHAWENVRTSICIERRNFYFLETKNQDNSYFHDPRWVVKLAFLVDITNHLNSLNLELQGKEKVVFVMFNQITAFERNFNFGNPASKKNFSHFPTLKNHARDIIPDIFVNYIKI